MADATPKASANGKATTAAVSPPYTSPIRDFPVTGSPFSCIDIPASQQDYDRIPNVTLQHSTMASMSSP